MRVLISGASGLVGTELSRALIAAGHQVVSLIRDTKKNSENTVLWDPKHERLDVHALDGIDAVVNLSGANLAQGRWTEKRKRGLLNSRVKATKTLVKAICLSPKSPKVLINASAIGFYGDHGEEVCTEATTGGVGFLADVCRQWEEAAAPAVDKGIRTVFLRTGIVLSPQGGAFAKMLPLFKIGLGGRLGSGEQFMSWIAIDDVISIILFALSREDLRGAVNVVAPNPVTNATFTSMLGKALHRPTLFPAPTFALRLVLGKEMADELLLSSIRVEPKKLEMFDFTFKYPQLDGAFKHLLGESQMATQNVTKSDKSFVATLLFCLLLGTLGVHRFYVGKIGTGILMLLTVGGFGIWLLIDFILICCARFRDSQGFLIEP